MTKTQVYRWYCDLWRRMTEGDGYQPWGYDMVTLKITCPGYVKAMYRLSGLYREAEDG